jgi:hypothetical protein
MDPGVESSSPMRTRLPLLTLCCLVLTVSALGLTGCRQATCVWTNVKTEVCETFRNPCRPDACGRVWGEPVYESLCSDAAPAAGTGRGAFPPVSP